MLWIGDKYFEGGTGEVVRDVPRLDEAIAAVKGREDELSSLNFTHADEQQGYGFGHDVEAEFASSSAIDDPCAFFAASRLGRAMMRECGSWHSWRWEPMTRGWQVEQTGTETLRPVIGEVVEAGWILTDENDRIDEDTTWSRRRTLFRTKSHFVVMVAEITSLH